jgi:Mg2+ and Co2+ transporter CorA
MTGIEKIMDFDSPDKRFTEIQFFTTPYVSTVTSKFSAVILYDPINHTYTKITNYTTAEILFIINDKLADNFLIVQIDNDKELYEEVIKLRFKADFDNIYKMFDLKLDYCFSPIHDLLCFNLSVLTNIFNDEVEKYLLQIFFYNKGLYIINKDSCKEILKIFIDKFNFIEVNQNEFFLRTEIKKNNKINNIDYKSLVMLGVEMNGITLDDRNLRKNKKRRGVVINNEKRELNEIYIEEKNFSTDDLIYWLFTFSIEKLEGFTLSLEKEVDDLKSVYLDLSQNERKDFLQKIHKLEVSMQLARQETTIKKKFLKHSKSQFKVYNKLSNNFYFKNSFNFFIELMISKVSQIEIRFEKLENIIKMIKQNFSIILEYKTEKQNNKTNTIMKVLTILTTIYSPINIVSGLWGMNIQVPFKDTDSYWPFLGMIMFFMTILVLQLMIIKKLKWF